MWIVRATSDIVRWISIPGPDIFGGVAKLVDGENGLEIHLDIQYVHQLQNLYFALTGEELKRKQQ